VRRGGSGLPLLRGFPVCGSRAVSQAPTSFLPSPASGTARASPVLDASLHAYPALRGPRPILGDLTTTIPLRECPYRGCLKLWGVRSPLRSTWYPVSASPLSFGFHLLHRCHTREEWWVRPASAGTCTRPEAPSFAWRTNAGHHLLAWSASGMPVRCMPLILIEAPSSACHGGMLALGDNHWRRRRRPQALLHPTASILLWH
jgi:hypothetical protein